MCGITGFAARTAMPAEWMRTTVIRMASTLRHRGPDDSGEWVDADHGLAFGFRRLAVLDLSPLGHQPMTSRSGRFTVVFNGEIYNHASLRTELRSLGHVFVGASDTEVILAAFERWDIRESLSRFVGMFAIAVLDRNDWSLSLIRDRLGEKPLYYGRIGDAWVFSSELRALCEYPDFRREVDSQAVAAFTRLGYVPAPLSIYRGIKKLPQAHMFRLSASGSTELTQYWVAASFANPQSTNSLDRPDGDYLEDLHTLLRSSVAQQMVADVPVGALLSGGVDSSLVVALMQSQTASRVRTFTLGYHNHAYSETGPAALVARHLGTEHHELIVTPSLAMDVIPGLPVVYDEPFADSSQIPTLLVSKLARGSVTVSLSGDGGDELFGGYNRHLWAPRIWRAASWIPGSARRALGTVMSSVPTPWYDTIFRAALAALPRKWRVASPGDKIQKLASAIHARNEADFYRRLVSAWPGHEGEYDRTSIDDFKRSRPFSSFAEQMMLYDLLTYLPDDILVKVDRASMAHALEVRTPYLDHRLVEFALRLPNSLRFRDGVGKWALRQVLHRYVPRGLVERPKMGFGIPVGDWLRGSLRPWAEDLLSDPVSSVAGVLDQGTVRRVWRRHLTGNSDETQRLWPILMLQAWTREWRC